MFFDNTTQKKNCLEYYFCQNLSRHINISRTRFLLQNTDKTKTICKYSKLRLKVRITELDKMMFSKLNITFTIIKIITFNFVILYSK